MSELQVQSFKEWLKTSFSVDLEVRCWGSRWLRAPKLRDLGQDLGVELRCDRFGGIGVFAPWLFEKQQSLAAAGYEGRWT